MEMLFLGGMEAFLWVAVPYTLALALCWIERMACAAARESLGAQAVRGTDLSRSDVLSAA
jgi:hypothetical protein